MVWENSKFHSPEWGLGFGDVCRIQALGFRASGLQLPTPEKYQQGRVLLLDNAADNVTGVNV